MMLKLIERPLKAEWDLLLKRPYVDNTDVMNVVKNILTGVKLEGDDAILRFNASFGGSDIKDFKVTEEEVRQALAAIPYSLQNAIRDAFKNIEDFHSKQASGVTIIQTQPGIECWRKSVPIEKVGLYIPGGSAPLFSTVLMLAIPAKLAGCKEIILCTPANKDGTIHPAILFAASLCGITTIFKIGGAQAIAAMAYGTEQVPAVYKIFGPGNQYVTAAKQLIQMEGVAIDMPAGPSEVCVLADESADPSFVAADLLSQAEHGADSQVLLVTTSTEIVTKCLDEIEKQLQSLPRKDVAQKSLANSKAIIVKDIKEAIALVNEYAAEHLIISCKDAELLSEQVINAGSVFIGNYSPESVGDYASGTNHTLPTNGFAKAYSGVSLDSFVKKITYQKLNSEGLQNISETVITMAEAEGLQAHANAIRVRLESLPVSVTPGSTGPAIKAFDLDALTRENIKNLTPYSSARSEYSGKASIFLDANENSFGSPLTKWYNRYPDPQQWELKEKIATIKNIQAANILLGNGSDECIDLLIRAFCNPGKDNIIICPPTYGMYEVNAHINDVAIKEVPLLPGYQLDLDRMEATIDQHTKIIFLCSPNNPTGNSLDREDIEIILNNFNGLVVLDEAYINYSRQRSFIPDLKDYPNLVVMQTFSKAWGLAALRLGMVCASEEIIHILNKIKPPYNINSATQELALKALDQLEDVNAMIKETVKEREGLVKELVSLTYVKKVFPSDANFLLVKMQGANNIYHHLKSIGIIVRNRSNVLLCEDSLRITVGTPEENKKLVSALKELQTNEK